MLLCEIGRYLLCRLSISLLYCNSVACNLLVLFATQCVCLCIEECVPVNSGRKGTRKTSLKTTTCFSFFVYIVVFGCVCVCVENLYLLTLTPHHLSEFSPTTLIAAVLMGVQKSAEELRGRRQVVACVNLLLDLFKAN